MMCIYTDVLTFDSPETILAPTADSMLVLAARVLTAEAPVTLKVHPALYIHPEPTSDGPETNHARAAITVQTDSISIEYYQQDFDKQDKMFEATLATQLRNAQALFWQKPSITISLCADRATATARPALYPALNAQAAALSQQS
ncbi:predicted protein [Aspergillus terreus NIH2624]|uniref:Uncharacterized protein n=1 Tax=Aspergillus terreus (strain NIH 2624 / FGSC A1156) TaxID=341663 RepID=Q0CZB7_ASPTN|nr:uncharacterized protein ATEG_00967 [Aspergillus terreus NIH2624]EAU39613.1 predicted protein [Aspergillus terreus NIH2624]